jgi:hypothetical protein
MLAFGFKPSLANELFKKAWDKRESYKAATVKMRSYCRPFGIIIPEYSAVEGVLGNVSGIDPKTIASMKRGAVVLVIVIFLAYLIWNYFGTLIQAKINAQAMAKAMGKESQTESESASQEVSLTSQEWTYIFAGVFVLAVALYTYFKWESVLILFAKTPEEKAIRTKILNGENEFGDSDVNDLLKGKGKFDSSYEPKAKKVADDIFDAKGSVYSDYGAVLKALEGKTASQIVTIIEVFEREQKINFEEFISNFGYFNNLSYFGSDFKRDVLETIKKAK